MTTELLLYTRRDCCLCEEMKEVVRESAKRYPVTMREIDVDGFPALQEKYGNEVPVLFVNGRKAFKYRLTSRDLEKILRKKGRG
jgi:glutaredoxin